MQALLEHGRKLGLSTAEAEAALKLNRPSADSTWVTGEDLGGEALKIAQDSMEQDRIVEYSCYDDQGNPQGRAVLRLMDWEDKDEGLLVAEHGECSDEYYHWYAQHQLTKGEGAIYHICRSSARKCKFKLPRRDKRTVIHLDRWRLMSPATMLAADYLKVVGSRLGKEQLALAAEDKKRRREEQEKGHPAGTGIDGALDEARANVPPFPPPPAPSEERRGRDKDKRSEKEKEKRRKRSLSEQLAENVKRSQEAERSRSRKRKSKKKKEAKRSKKKRGLDESSSESGRSSSSESSHFQSAPARGGDLWRIAQKKPGQLATRNQVFSRTERGRSRRTHLGRAESAGILESSGAGQPSTLKDRAKVTSGIGHSGHERRRDSVSQEISRRLWICSFNASKLWRPRCWTEVGRQPDTWS